MLDKHLIRAQSTPSRVAVFVTILLALGSCQGITSNVETLRAERVEIVDRGGALQMDVASKIRALEDRVQKLEAALEKRAAEEAAAAASARSAAASAPPTPPASASSPAKPAPPPSASSPAKPAPGRPSTPSASGRAPEIF